MARIRNRNISPERGDWDKFYEGIEQCFPASLAERLAPKKFRRYKKRSLAVKLDRRGGGSVVCSCMEVDQDLFHEFAPPSGLVTIGLEDLI
jgi:hypothetical protein